jgi:hypothetical protein
MVKGDLVVPLADSSRSMLVGEPPATSAVLTLTVQPSVKLALRVVAPYWLPSIPKDCPPDAAVKVALAKAAVALARTPPAIAILVIMGFILLSCPILAQVE